VDPEPEEEGLLAALEVGLVGRSATGSAEREESEQDDESGAEEVAAVHGTGCVVGDGPAILHPEGGRLSTRNETGELPVGSPPVCLRKVVLWVDPEWVVPASWTDLL
jgi:hypothetical protein